MDERQSENEGERGGELIGCLPKEFCLACGGMVGQERRDVLTEGEEKEGG